MIVACIKEGRFFPIIFPFHSQIRLVNQFAIPTVNETVFHYLIVNWPSKVLSVTLVTTAFWHSFTQESSCALSQNVNKQASGKPAYEKENAYE